MEKQENVETQVSTVDMEVMAGTQGVDTLVMILKY
jgi:hypothetical protein